jgi:Zn-dependent M16 (insulinase) family peptidase
LTVQQRQTQYTGSLNFFSDITPVRSDRLTLGGFCGLSSKALHKNLEAMIGLMDDTFAAARFDELDRIKDLIAQIRSGREQGVTGNGHGLAMMAAGSTLSPVKHISHMTNGLAGIKTLKALDDSLSETSALEKLCDQFKTLHGQLQAMPRGRLLVSDQTHWAELSEQLQLAGDSMDAPAFEYAFTPTREHQAWVTNTQVNFCAKVFPTVSAEHADTAALRVLAQYLRDGYLHRAIREEGGAYGGGATYDHNCGLFRFYSYRDPRLLDTMADFDKSIQWLLNDKHDPEALEQAILGVVSMIDKPFSPSGEAISAFQSLLRGRSAETLNADRQRVLQVSMADLKRVAEQYLGDANSDKQAMAVVTNAQQVAGLTHPGDFARYDL